MVWDHHIVGFAGRHKLCLEEVKPTARFLKGMKKLEN